MTGQIREEKQNYNISSHGGFNKTNKIKILQTLETKYIWIKSELYIFFRIPFLIRAKAIQPKTIFKGFNKNEVKSYK